jgi:hypothetical protein
MAIPLTPARKLPIVARVRSTRKGQVVVGRDSGSMGVEGRDGTHFYEITVVGGVSVPERLACSCPAHRFGKANQVKVSGLCKHLQMIKEEIEAGELREGRTEKGNIIVYSLVALKSLFGLR